MTRDVHDGEHGSCTLGRPRLPGALVARAVRAQTLRPRPQGWIVEHGPEARGEGRGILGTEAARRQIGERTAGEAPSVGEDGVESDIGREAGAVHGEERDTER